jgi:predicted nucleotidyltransferase
MNEVTTIFVNELKTRPDVLGIIMFGSWARGNNRPDSDVDLLVIQSEGYRRSVEYKNKQAFEIIYTNAQSALEFWQSKKDDCAGLWAVAKIVYDKDGTTQQIKVKAEEIITEGKKTIDEYQKGQFKFSAEDEIKAVEAIMFNDEATANLVLAYTVLGLTSLFFDLYQQWIPAPKQRLAKIKEIQPELGLLFENFYSDISLKEKIKVAKNIVPIVFEN